MLPSSQGITGLYPPLPLSALKMRWNKAHLSSLACGTQGDPGESLLQHDLVWCDGQFSQQQQLWFEPRAPPTAPGAVIALPLTKSLQRPSSVAGNWEPSQPSHLASPLSSDLVL